MGCDGDCDVAEDVLDHDYDYYLNYYYYCSAAMLDAANFFCSSSDDFGTKFSPKLTENIFSNIKHIQINEKIKKI